MNAPPRLDTADLAPGDRAIAAPADRLRVRRVCDPAEPAFGAAYQRLWDEFGAHGEMETRRVIEDRLRWDPAHPRGREALLYELLLLERDGFVVGLRDHTAVVRRDDDGRRLPGPVVVHLSHALVDPAHRGTGLAPWLRALPVAAARHCAACAGVRTGAPIVLVAEMEPLVPGCDAMRKRRLQSYARAGFQKIDPAAAPYRQPDFREPETLAGRAPQSIPLSLIVRRVGREGERDLPASEVRAIVESIYAVYGAHVPAAFLDPLRDDAARWLARTERPRLLSPTE